jgi:hypothetical protein
VVQAQTVNPIVEKQKMKSYPGFLILLGRKHGENMVANR